ncbi:hypothetical protein HOLDEFILI_00656 [Holdemania filiformis DSM 12042]|uniref:Uncharacterized protein n=1 Tax=Holdemania filiformis DSM 12042 TaxID=545696 RepID=B9Y4C5_9FIRM|nr:hypothetical protein HOLDEFILI_00656 [Holdemania filiformis DSM 12042]
MREQSFFVLQACIEDGKNSRFWYFYPQRMILQGKMVGSQTKKIAAVSISTKSKGPIE